MPRRFTGQRPRGAARWSNSPLPRLAGADSPRQMSASEGGVLPYTVLSDRMCAVRIEFAQSARRHRIGRARARHVIANPVVEVTVPDEEGRDDRLVYLGDDRTGRALEVMAVPTEAGILVIHVMDLRPKWHPLYEEGKR
jgi:hypothetical protein